jgi:hypothetical protein
VNSADSELAKKVRQFASAVAATRVKSKSVMAGAVELVVVLGNFDKAREMREYLENELGVGCGAHTSGSNRIMIPVDCLVELTPKFPA